MRLRPTPYRPTEAVKAASCALPASRPALRSHWRLEAVKIRIRIDPAGAGSRSGALTSAVLTVVFAPEQPAAAAAAGVIASSGLTAAVAILTRQ